MSKGDGGGPQVAVSRAVEGPQAMHRVAEGLHRRWGVCRLCTGRQRAAVGSGGGDEGSLNNTH